MLSVYVSRGSSLERISIEPGSPPPEEAVWIDLITPTVQEDKLVEKLLGIEVPKRAQYVRVMLVELQRISSHLVWLGTHAIDLGAMSVFLYCFREREEILKIFERFAGQRMMTSYIRIGGDRKSTRLNSSHRSLSRMPSSV